MLEYTETIFREPETITEEQYLSIRQQTFSNPNFTIIDYKINLYEKFKRDIWAIGILLSISLICFGIDYFLTRESDFIEVIGGISGLLFLILLLSFIKSSTSYTSAMEKRNDYFAWMHFCIFSSSNLLEYYTFFYKNQTTQANKELTSRYKNWRSGKK
ncbi:hypothetical protein [Ferruginibacter sp.]|nr:hypothetical protein [Ferruginibacter sp.]